MKRQYCSGCNYPLSVCVCPAVRAVHSQVKLIILQHPSEANHAKNTARLINLCLPETLVYCGETEQDFAELKAMTLKQPQDFALFYPNDQSAKFEARLQNSQPLPFKQLIFIDATWRKAYKMWKLNPWLANIQSFQFESPQQGKYLVRKAPDPQSLSTLEAVAYALEQGYKCDTRPLITLFEYWQGKAFAQHEKIIQRGGENSF